MSIILVVENEDRYIQRIEDTLSTEGWSTRLVSSPEEALQVGAQQVPSLVLVNSELEGVEVVYESFAKRNQGPGVIAMLPEHQATERSAQGMGVDGLVTKPFTDQELRLEVRRSLSGSPPPTAGRPAGPGEKLTSADIFGDLVAEIQEEIAGDSPTAPETASATPPPAAAAAVEAAPLPEPAAPPLPSDLNPPQTPPPPVQPPAVPSDADEIERKLELTLSGVLGADLSGATGTPQRKMPKKPSEPAADDVDQLLSNTLSGLAEAPKAKRADDEAIDPFAGLGLGNLVSEPRTAPRKEAAPPALDSAGKEDPPEVPASFEEPPSAATLEPSHPAAEARPPAIEPAQHPPLSPPPLNTELLEALSSESSAPGSTAPGSSASGSSALGNFTPDNRFADAPSSTEAEAPAEADAAATVAVPDPRESFGQYSLLERIAVGGMAEVWKARMRGVEGFQKTVAIKKILPHLNENEEFVSMFIDEAKLAAQLSHPNIIHIYDLGKIATNYYIAMEFVDGMNLREILTTARDLGKPMDQGLALLIGARLASALDYAHRKRDFEDRELGLVHRDVSPQNVLISQDGDIKLCDFGIAKAAAKASHTQMGALKGKIQYMSPEQAWGQPVDPRSDIFSVGTLLFEMLTGERLFGGDNEISVLEAVREAEVQPPRDVNPAIDADADRIVMTALAKDAADRFQSAGQLRDALEQALYSLQPTPGPADLAAYLDRIRNSDEATGPDAPDREPLAADPAGPGAPGLQIEPPPASAASSPAASISADSEVPPQALQETPQPVLEPALGAPPAIPDVPPRPSREVDIDLERALAGEPAGSPEPQPKTATGAPVNERAGEKAAEVSSTASTAPAKMLPDPAPPSGPIDTSIAKEASPVVEAKGPLDEHELEEGGGRSRKPLLLLIAVIVLIGLLAFLYYRFAARKTAEPPASQDPVVLPIEDGAPANEPSDPSLDSALEGEAAEGEGVDSGAAGAAGPDPDLSDPERSAPERSDPDRSAPQGLASVPEGATAPPAGATTAPSADGTAAAAAGTDEPANDMAEMVDQELARREEALRAKLEAEQKRLEDQLREAQEAARSAPADPPAPQPSDGAPPPAPTAEPESKSPAPAAARGPPTAAPPTGEAPIQSASDPAPTGPPPTATTSSAPPPQPASTTPSAAPESAPTEVPERPTTRRGDLVRAGPGVVAPKLVSIQKPEYPPIAKRMGVEGEVVLSVLVDENGKVVDTRFVERIDRNVGINEAAVRAARTAKYQPARKDDVVVKMWTTLRLPFRL
ncbi:MAG: TonB family protein [Acidobacteriota bacterium]